MNDNTIKLIRNEIIFSYLFTIIVISILSILSFFYLPFKGVTLPVTILLFLFVPYIIAKKKEIKIEEFGIKEDEILKDVIVGLGSATVIFPPFWLGTLFFWHFIFNIPIEFKFKLPNDIMKQFIVNLFLVALPEEFFYRGYIQSRIKKYFILKKMKNIKASISAIIITSIFFALSHIITIPSITRLSVFFPSILFGILREIRDSIYPSVILHGLSNIFMNILILSYNIGN